MRTDIVLDPEAVALLRSIDAQKPGSFSNLVRMFATEAPIRIKKMEAAYLAADTEALSLHAHYLRSACLALGAGQLAKTCHDLESIGAGDIKQENAESYLAPLHVQLNEAVTALLETIGGS